MGIGLHRLIMVAETETKSSTFTYRKETEQWLLETYPDAIGLNEAIRSAISDARLLREIDISPES